MSLTQDDLKILAMPFDEKTIGIKVQSFSKDRTKAMLVAYVQHTDCYSRIEQVDPNWTSEITQVLPIGDTVNVRVKLTIKGVSRENAGEGDDLKSATSDAIKRAAMLFGVSRYLYDADTVWVPYHEQNDRFRTFTYADYKNAARPGQSIAPTGPTLVPPAPQSGPKPAPKAAEKSEEYSPPKTKVELGKAIFDAKKQLSITDEVLASWVSDEFKKSARDLTIPEMQKLLEMLLTEVGRAG